jgi:hypothetical protein
MPARAGSGLSFAVTTTWERLQSRGSIAIIPALRTYGGDAMRATRLCSTGKT